MKCGKKVFNGLLTAALIGLTALLTGCGAGGASGGTSTTGGTTGNTTVAASLVLTLSDPATGNASNALTSGSPLTVTALLKDTAGAVVSNSVVTFTTGASFGTFSPASGTALTNASGIAMISLVAGSTTGAATVTASANVAATAVTGSIGYTVNVAQLGLSTLSFGTNPLSAYGTSNVTVTVTSGAAIYTTPTNVSFTSTCVTLGKAVLSPSVSTVNGLATASYRDNGCGVVDTITASLSNGATLAGNLSVALPDVSSVQFVSASPANLNVKGMGGTEVSTITFKVVDSGGNPIIGRTVNFSLDNTVGGLSLSSGSDITNGNGLAVALVHSGTILTPGRVTATTAGTSGTISTQSSQLYVSTGIPDQAHFSVSADKLNPEAWDYDGVPVVVTARLADRSGNPVPDGTAVVFTTEGGAITSGCVTGTSGNVSGATGGAGYCSVTWTSQAPRPGDGRSTILAYAIGEESFVDANGNGSYDQGETFTDQGEAYRDDNENGLYDLGEFFVDFNSNRVRDSADTLFTGVLCNTGCSPTHTLNVSGSLVLVFSKSSAVLPIISPRSVDLGGCTTQGSIHAVTLTLGDVNGNPLPVGTTVVASVSGDGTLVGPVSFTMPSSNVHSPSVFTVRIQNDATGSTCTDATSAGTLTVIVTTPKGLLTTDTIAVTN